jgi:hypothetical protein
MISRIVKLSTIAAILVATAAIFAPAASADPPYNTALAGPVASNGQPRDLPPIDTSSALRFQRAAAYHSAGFDWTAAGIGGVAATVAIVVFGVTFDLRRRRQPSVA